MPDPITIPLGTLLLFFVLCFMIGLIVGTAVTWRLVKPRLDGKK